VSITALFGLLVCFVVCVCLFVCLFVVVVVVVIVVVVIVVVVAVVLFCFCFCNGSKIKKVRSIRTPQIFPAVAIRNVHDQAMANRR